jgi:hypothetical protein
MTSKKYSYKSFQISDKTRIELEFLASIYGECASAVIRRLITEAYAVQVELAKKMPPPEK